MRTEDGAGFRITKELKVISTEAARNEDNGALASLWRAILSHQKEKLFCNGHNTRGKP